MHHTLLVGVLIYYRWLLYICSGNSSMGLPDKIHWVGTFLLSSEDHTILTAISWNFLAMMTLFSMMLYLSLSLSHPQP